MCASLIYETDVLVKARMWLNVLVSFPSIINPLRHVQVKPIAP
jgi:hypothetical protein